MRLVSLILDSYGPFLNQELTFDPTPGRINLLVAPNGAGKSVLRGAFSDLLFDIGHQSPMTFAYPAARLRLTARVRLEGGGTRVLMRRKGQGNTLSDGAEPIAPEDLRGLLGGADQDLFEALFALDSHALRRGGGELSHSKGQLGHMLLAGGGGLGTERLRDEMIRDRDAIGRADHRHIARPLWRAAAEAAEAGRWLAHAALRPDAWQGMEKRAADTERQLAVLREERVALEAELSGLTALRAVRPWLARRDAALAVLAAAGEVPRLEPDFEVRWHRAVEEHVRFGAAAAERVRQAAEAATLAGQAPDTTLLQAAGQIEQVLRDAVTAASATNDLPHVEAGYHDAVVEAARLRRELGWEATVPLPPAPALRAARELLTARTGLVADAENTARELAKARQHLKGARADLDALPPAEDTAALAALVRDLRAAGDPARRLDTARRARRDAEAALVAALAALPERALTREQLAESKAPAEATLAACEAALTEAETACRDALRECRGVVRDRAGAEADLAALTRTAALPEPGALAAARAARDRLWDDLRDGAAADAVGFERALRHADAVADTLIAHATQAAKAEGLRQDIETFAARQSAAELACKGTAERLTRAQEDLAALAGAAGAPAQAMPAALRAFLAARDTALQRGIALDRARAEEADLVAALDEAARGLADLGVAGEGLAPMLGAAETRVADFRDAVAARKAALADVPQSRARHAGPHRRRGPGMPGAGGVDGGVARCRGRVGAARWGVAGGHRRGAGTGRAVARAGNRRRFRECPHPAYMRAAIDGFAAGIAALCAQVAPDLAALPPREAAVRLRSMLRAQQDAATLRQADLRKRDKALAQAAEAGGKARAAATELAALRAALGAVDDEAAAAQLDRVRRVATADKELAEARRHIATQGGDQPEAQLEAMAAASSAEEELRIGALEARQAKLGPLIEAASAEARSAAEERDRAGQGEAAQEAAARREAALATLARHAEEALVLHAAISLLRAGMAAGRDTEGSAAVARIGAVFRQITGGAHAEVAVQDDGTDRVLVALETDGTTAKLVGELSEGTSDQLYLALRIAALEAYVRANPPLPFIADDVLQTFDDVRATAALRALLDLSAHVQVIVLTHHPHVQTLARALPAGAVHSGHSAEPHGGGDRGGLNERYVQPGAVALLDLGVGHRRIHPPDLDRRDAPERGEAAALDLTRATHPTDATGSAPCRNGRRLRDSVISRPSAARPLPPPRWRAGRRRSPPVPSHSP